METSDTSLLLFLFVCVFRFWSVTGKQVRTRGRAGTRGWERGQRRQSATVAPRLATQVPRRDAPLCARGTLVRALPVGTWEAGAHAALPRTEQVASPQVPCWDSLSPGHWQSRRKELRLVSAGLGGTERISDWSEWASGEKGHGPLVFRGYSPVSPQEVRGHPGGSGPGEPLEVDGVGVYAFE